MLTIVVTMLVIVVLAVLVVAYVAFPHRGHIPQASWLSNGMTKTVDKVAPDRADPKASAPAPTRGARAGSNAV
jgi:hypothetical protein